MSKSQNRGAAGAAGYRRFCEKAKDDYPRRLATAMGGRSRPLSVDSASRALLERWARGRRVPFRLVIRSRIVLRAAAGLNNREIARALGVSPLTVACWRSRFALLGVNGIARDAPRLGSRRTVPASLRRAILRKTVTEAPPNGVAWTSRSLARAVGVSHTTVQRVWRAHPVRRYQTPIAALAHDPRLEPRSIYVAGVYLGAPHAAVVITDRQPRRGTKSNGPSSSPEAAGKGSRRSALELVQLLARLETYPTARSSAERSRKEFLAFLGTVADRHERGERSHLLLSRVDDALRSVAEKWTETGPESREVNATADGTLHETVGRWLTERSRAPRTEIALKELPELRRAVDRWASEHENDERPFAWVNPREPKHDA